MRRLRFPADDWLYRRLQCALDRLHVTFGFRQVGYLPSIGFKFGQWADMIMMQRWLGSGGTTAPDVWPTVASDDSGQ